MPSLDQEDNDEPIADLPLEVYKDPMNPQTLSV